MNPPLTFVHLTRTIDREEKHLAKKIAAAILLCAVMVMLAAAPLAMADTHHIVKGAQGPRASAISWEYVPLDYGTWHAKITNNGLRSLVVDVYDNSTGVPESVTHERIRFAAYPTNVVETLGSVMNPTHKYEITATPNGPKGTYCDVEDMFVNATPPVAVITVTSIVSLTVSVSGSESYDLDGTIMSYAWNFGDAATIVTGMTATHTYGVGGTYDITLVVADNDGLTGTDVERVTVSKDLIPPVARFTATPTFLVVSVDASASYDPDGTTLTYAWDFGDLTTGVGKITTHTYAAEGMYTITLTVMDDDGLSNSTSHDVLATMNKPPVLDPIGDKTVDELTLLTFTATATDPDIPAQTLTFSLSGTVPAGASITSAGVFTWTPSAIGDYTFDVVVSDGSLTDSETITVHVVATPNTPPVLAPIGSKNVNEMTLLTFTATATDADIPAQTLTFSLSGTVPAGASITSAGVFTWTPSEAQGPGDYTFNVVVSDGSLTDLETITVHVNEVNVAPVLAPIGSKTVDELTLLTFTATATDADIPAQTLTFSLSGTVPAGASITSAGVFTWTPSEAQGPGDYTFGVVVSDGSLTDSETITVHVNEDNSPVAFFTWTASGLTVNVDATGSTDDHSILSYVWNWGDGTTGTDMITSHTYVQPVGSPGPAVSAPIVAQDTLPPYLLYGYTTDALGNPIECTITVTNLRTGAFNTTNSFQVDPWPLDGYYEIDIQHALAGAFLPGDQIKVDAVSRTGGMTGSTTSIVPTPPGGSLEIDVTVTGGVVHFDRTITLTVTDTKGQTSTYSVTVTLPVP